MTQAMIELRKNKKYSTVYTQTEDSDEFCIYLSYNKTLRIYNSKTYKGNVLSFNFGNSKKYIITKPMWKIMRKYIPKIDRILLEYKDSQNL